MEKMKLVVATPLYESKGWGNYIRSLVKATAIMERLKIQKPLEFDYDVWHTEGDSYVDNARNELAKMFLKGDGTHLFFWDSDLKLTMDGFARLLKAPVEVVGAAFPVKNAWNRWAVQLSTSPEGDLLRNKETGLYKADRIATGALKIARTAFEKIMKADSTNWHYDYASQTMTYGFFNFMRMDKYLLKEDYGFCERCKKVGIQIWAETRVETGHMGIQEHCGSLHGVLGAEDVLDEKQLFT